MEDSHSDCQEESGNEVKPSQRKEEDVVEELILDYACKNNMQPVISEILRGKSQTWCQDVRIPHLRFLAATLHSVVHSDAVKKFEQALRILLIIHDAKSDLVSAKHYVKLMAGMKTKIILDKLRTDFDYATVVAKLNQYFPKSELHTSKVSREQARLNSYQLHLRRKLTRLIITPSERQAMNEDEDNELGTTLTTSIKDLVTTFTDRLNGHLTVPVIEQISSEGPHSQISKDVQDSPTTCMDHLLSICFKGTPSQDQLLALVSYIKQEQAKASAESESDIFRLSSSSSSGDEKRQRRSTRIRAGNKRGQGVTAGIQDKPGHSLSKKGSGKAKPWKGIDSSCNRGSSRHSITKNTSLAAIEKHTDHSDIRNVVTDVSGRDKRPSTRTRQEHSSGSQKSTTSGRKHPIDRHRRQNKQTLSDATHTSSSAIVNQGNNETLVLSDEPSEETRLDHPPSQVTGSRNKLNTDEAVVSKDQPGNVVTEPVSAATSWSSPPKSKIYFSRASRKVSRLQQSGLANSARTGDNDTINRPCKPTGSITNPTNPMSQSGMNDRKGTSEERGKGTAAVHSTPSSQQNSGSSGSSSQSTTSLSLFSGSRGKVVRPAAHKERRPVVQIEKDQELQSEEYAGSIRVIEETPSSGEMSKSVMQDSPPDQCNIISSSSSSGSSMPSQPSQPSQCVEVIESPKAKQGSDAASTMDVSIVYPSPEARETSTKYTFLRTPLVPTQESSNDCDIILASDSDVSSDESVVSDSEGSTLSEEDSVNCSEVLFEGSQQSRRRIPSLRSYLQSPVTQESSLQVTSTTSHQVFIIKPCAVVLHRLKEAEIKSYTQVLRRSKRRRQMVL